MARSVRSTTQPRAAFPTFAQAAEAASFLTAHTPGTGGAALALTGLRGAAGAKLLCDFLPQCNAPILALLPEPEGAEDLAADLLLFGCAATLLPPWDILPAETETPDLDLAKDQVNALRQLATGKPGIVVTSAVALLQPMLPPALLESGQLSVRAGQNVSPESLAARLTDAGFEHTDEVERQGQFARRGGIMDVYPFFAERPARLEFFGDEIETVRFFDPGTQRSDAPAAAPVTLIDINRDSFRRAYLGSAKTRLFDYLPAGAVVALFAPHKLEHAAELYSSGFAQYSPLIPLTEALRGLAERPLLLLPELSGDEWPESVPEPARRGSLDCGCAGLERLEGGLDTAVRELRLIAQEGAQISVVCNNAAERTRLEEVLRQNAPDLLPKLALSTGSLSRGFYLTAARWAVVGDHEILGRTQLRRTPRKKIASLPLASLHDLRPGDYVVHLAHGIALCEGIETLENGGTRADYLRLRFAEEARIYVPLSHIELVQRYIGSGEVRPELSRLGGAAWQRRKKAAAAAAKDIAADLLRLQAARQAMPGIPFPADDEMMREFEAAFPYQETPDQLSAICDIKADQEKTSPMDRLLCGDVGFGKTEVAMRAAFKAVNAGKQVAVLVPTTILAEQHARTFRDRMMDYPVTVACLSRFRSPAETREIIDRLETGGIDVVVGTHRILSRDVKFRDIGLVIIDEEQRFGVEQKERLKEMRMSVDILSMSATPIPRTLNMALLGLRDISSLATPPTERQAIRTEVVRYNEELIRRAVLRELARGGQIFFLHNRVHNIQMIAQELTELVPEARFGVAHGQMGERDLFRVMRRFIERQLDVLVCTTIIESGVDIPSVNTLFVNNADHFGLGELHQLRGRVGRYRHKAYAYFLVPPKRPVSPVAQKRLQALEEYSELGAGFRLAMRDLEIRGAGNILGAEQSGHIHLVGFELYCRLLEKAVAELKGEESEDRDPVELDLGTISYIPTEYVPADAQRIELYRKLSSCADENALAALFADLRDRYGAPPEPVHALCEDQRLRQAAQDAGINFLGRLEHALVVGFAAGQGGASLRKLRLMRRKITPLDRGRWRIEIGAKETAHEAARKITARLRLSPQEIAELEVQRETLRAAPPPEGAPATTPDNRIRFGHDRTYQQTAAALGGTYLARIASEENDARPAAAVEAGTPVLGLEPDERLGTVGAVINEGGFDLRRFGPVTLVFAAGRFFMRYTGASHQSGGRVTLHLRADSSDDVRAAMDAHLGGGGRVHYGIFED